MFYGDYKKDRVLTLEMVRTLKDSIRHLADKYRDLSLTYENVEEKVDELIICRGVLF